MKICVLDENNKITNILEAPYLFEENHKYFNNWNILGETYTDVEPLNHAKERYIEAAKNYRDSQEVQPITYNGNVYDYDAKARERLLIARTAIEDAGGTGTIDWTLADQSRIAISLDDFKGINAAAAARSNTLHVNYSNTKAALLAAATISELEQIYPLGGE